MLNSVGINNKLNAPAPVYSNSFEKVIANCIRELDLIHGFLIPSNQITDIRALNLDQLDLSESEKYELRGLYQGTYLHGLKVCL